MTSRFEFTGLTVARVARAAVATGLAAGAVLLSGCGAGQSSPEEFCAQLKDLRIKLAGMQNDSGGQAIQEAIDDLSGLLESAPSEIKDAAQQELDALKTYQETRDESAFSSPAASAAGNQLLVWVQERCAS